MLFWVLTAISLCIIGLVIRSACGCCCQSYSDDFSSNHIATDYTASGSWSVVGGKLTTTSTSAILVVNTNDGVSGVISLQIDEVSTSHVRRRAIRLYGAYTDPNNCVYAEVDVDGTNLPFGQMGGSLKLYERAGGVDTLLESASQGTTLTSGDITITGAIFFKLCWHAGNASAIIGSGEAGTGWRVTGNHSQTGVFSAIGTGSTASNISLDNLNFASNFYDFPTCGTRCESCRDVCADGLPATLDVTLPSSFSNTTCNCATQFNGQTFTLNLQTDTCIKLDQISADHVPCLYRYFGTSPFTGACNSGWQLEILAYFGTNVAGSTSHFNELSVELRIWTGLGTFACPAGGGAAINLAALWKVTGLALQQTCAGGSWSLPYVSKHGTWGSDPLHGDICDLTSPGNVAVAA